MFRCQILDIYKCQIGESTKHENIPYKGKAWESELLIHDSSQFFLRKKFHMSLIMLELDSKERVFFHPIIGQSDANDFLQVFQMLDT
ncbi:hypothetical protein SDC9_195713 [bioreactor metagenome]|uniref:Uncharacterized protein n=1 Tax=bioreactor metagenome TaxID=1076179 RepID=A0A645ICC4_9ZZZZ